MAIQWLRVSLLAVVAFRSSQANSQVGTSSNASVERLPHQVQGSSGFDRWHKQLVFSVGPESQQVRRQLEEKKSESSSEKSGSDKEAGEEAEAEEKEEEIDETSLATAGVLIAAVVVVVTIFYLVNNTDPNIRQAAWNLISDTVSIFCAVLWYQGVDALYDEAFPSDEDSTARICLGLVHFLFWYVLVQAVAIDFCASRRVSVRIFRASCVLGAHLSGFAAKEWFNSIMQSKTFRDSVGLAIVALLISCGCLFAICATAYCIRNLFVYPRVLDEETSEECGEEIREIENDMVSLSLGFLISQVIRFAIHGELPSEELDEKDHHEQWQSWLLLFFAAVFAGIAVCIVKLKLLYQEGFNKHVARLVDDARLTMVFTMAWCLLYWGQWEIFDTHLVKHRVLARLVLAGCMSALSIAFVFIIDAIADHSRSRFGKRSARLLMYGFGLALAFSWEQTFDLCIEEMAKGTTSITEAQAKMILAALLVGIVAPAWAMHILPKTQTLDQVLEHVAEELEESKREHAELKLQEAVAPSVPCPIGAIAPEPPSQPSTPQAWSAGAALASEKTLASAALAATEDLVMAVEPELLDAEVRPKGTPEPLGKPSAEQDLVMTELS